ncbi:MAG: glutamate ligase domain-containing protein, partial [Mailhella sp.]
AAAAAHLSGLSCQEIKHGVETAFFPSQRFARHEIPGWTVIDDTYNANPLSASRMIEASAELARGKAFVCVMGAMAELGALSAEEHRKLGRILAGTCEALFWFGSHREDIQKGLEEASFSGVFFPLSSLEEFLPAITCWEKRYRENDSREGLILFKGSRVNRMERLVNLFMEQKNHAL